jgi:hypothetical protein
MFLSPCVSLAYYFSAIGTQENAEKSVTSNKVTKAKFICSNLFKLYIILYIL